MLNRLTSLQVYEEAMRIHPKYYIREGLLGPRVHHRNRELIVHFSTYLRAGKISLFLFCIGGCWKLLSKKIKENKSNTLFLHSC